MAYRRPQGVGWVWVKVLWTMSIIIQIPLPDVEQRWKGEPTSMEAAARMSL